MLPTLETTRLRLRPFTAEDSAEIQRLAGDRAIADTTISIPHPYPDGAAKQWVATHEELFKEGKELQLAIERKEDKRLIGAIGLVNIEQNHQAELGYWVGRAYWNKGYATEAAESLVRYALSELHLNRVHATHLARNPASGRVLEKIGMTHEGRRRQHILKWGKGEDIVLLGILKEDRTNN
jgi:[ribosomal protein S5]-alanine N-acetyltransferase